MFKQYKNGRKVCNFKVFWITFDEFCRKEVRYKRDNLSKSLLQNIHEKLNSFNSMKSMTNNLRGKFCDVSQASSKY
jgi:hypothetical protein